MHAHGKLHERGQVAANMGRMSRGRALLDTHSADAGIPANWKEKYSPQDAKLAKQSPGVLASLCETFLCSIDDRNRGSCCGAPAHGAHIMAPRPNLKKTWNSMKQPLKFAPHS